MANLSDKVAPSGVLTPTGDGSGLTGVLTPTGDGSGLTGVAPLASPVFSGTPTAPTPTFGTDTTQVATTAFVLANAGNGLPSFVLEDQKSSGSAGGSSSTGWATRDLNTEVYDPDGLVSISSNRFTVTKSGWVEWESVVYSSDRVRVRLYDVTSGSVAALSLTKFFSRGDNVGGSVSGGGPVIAGHTYELQGRAQVAIGSTGFGLPSGFDTEVYTRVIGHLA